MSLWILADLSVIHGESRSLDGLQLLLLAGHCQCFLAADPSDPCDPCGLSTQTCSGGLSPSGLASATKLLQVSFAYYVLSEKISKKGHSTIGPAPRTHTVVGSAPLVSNPANPKGLSDTSE